MTLLITNLLSPLPLQVGVWRSGFGVCASVFMVCDAGFRVSDLGFRVSGFRMGSSQTVLPNEVVS